MTRPSRWHDLILPLSIVAGVFVILVPLPAALLDLLLAINLALSVIILLTTVYVASPVDFGTFPTLLLATTLGRLVLNVASTRLILTHAPTLGIDAAGGVIRGFGEFVTGDRLLVGIVLFAIIFTIQFVVITKGATRISEVAARFALDGLPGRQMAIDADVQAGLIDHAEAQRRRAEVGRQAEFYGAMDGAGKFVRGDAIAGLLILLVNLLGGVILGFLDGQLSLSQIVDVFSRLTIGDGLVTQVPALLISLAAGLLVTRSGQRTNLSQEMTSQLFYHPRVLLVAGLFLLLLITTSLPTLPLALLGTGCLALSYQFGKRRPAATGGLTASHGGGQPGSGHPGGGSGATAGLAATGSPSDSLPLGTGQLASTHLGSASPPARSADMKATREERIEDFLAIDPLEVNLGLRLLRLADPQRGGDLLRRVTGVRQRIASELGIVLPKVRIRDDLKLGERAYRIQIANNVVAEGTLHVDRILAVDTGMTTGKLAGEETIDPATKLPAHWIPTIQRERAEALGYQLWEPATALAHHLQETVRQHADELLSRDAVRHLIDELHKSSPAVVDELVPSMLRLAEIQQVLQHLLREEVPIRQLSLILETLGDHAQQTRDTWELAEEVRRRLARTLMACHRTSDSKLPAITLDPAVEQLLLEALDESVRPQRLQLSPAAVETLCSNLQQALVQAKELSLLSGGVRGGQSAVILVSGRIRAPLRQLLGRRLGRVSVISYEEVTADTLVESIITVDENYALSAMVAE
ncbi:MAG: flagellar biosynthesis protein FlhA [Planctomycetota bacterium]